MSEIVLMGDPRVAATPVSECAEDLVSVLSVDDLAVGGLRAEASGAYARLRSGLVDRLLDAQASLPKDLRLVFIEGYRPDHLQRLYFDRYRQGLVDADPDLAPADSFLLASRYVSPPDVAPHVSGAAVDLTLVDPAGNEVDMGTPVNATPEASAGACYFAAENISREARRHRSVLGEAMSGAGLVNYPTEWWHWSYGDRYWALLTGRPAAIYGPVLES